MARTYSGEFRSVIRDRRYSVTIVTSGSGNPVELTFGPDAFTTSMDGGSSTIYTPVKYQSGTIQVVAKDYYFDLYASTPKENSVIVQELDASGNVSSTIWKGYVSCNVYDADYNFETESWDVECVDGLSVLKNFDYTIIGNERGFASFTQLINKCLSTAGCYTKWYMSAATKDASYNGNLIDSLYISESNFFDEDEEPMKLNEVFEEILKYIGVTAVADGDNVYFMDYDAIRHGNNSYYEYNVGSSSSNTTVSLSKSHLIGPNSYSSTGTRLSLDNVYSKVTVKDSLYPVKSIIPSLFEDEDLRNTHATATEENWNYEFTTSCVYGGKESWLDTWETRASDDVYFKIKSRFYENKKYNHYYFTNTGSSTSGPILNALQAEDLTGVAFAKYNIGSGNTESAANAGLDYDSFDNYLMIPNNYSTTTNLKRLEAKPEFSKPFFMSGKTKIIVKGDLILTDRALFPNSPQADNNTNIGYWPHTGTFTSLYDGNFWHGTKLFPKQNIINLKIGLNIGGYGGTYKVPFYPVGEGEKTIREDSKNHEIFYTSFGVQDNVNYLDCIKEKGYKINTGMPTDTVIPAKPRISIYGMDDMVTAFATPAPYTGSVLGCLFIKDFDVVAADPYEGSDERVNGTDTEYSVEINADYVTELSPIEFKVCTSDGKSLNYSSVAIKTGETTYRFVKEFTNSSLGQTLIPEWMMCHRLVNQYSTPSKRLTINLFSDLVKPYSLISEPQRSEYNTPLTGCTFIIDRYSYSLSMDTITCELVEKKS